jgi:hypothetical protein
VPAHAHYDLIRINGQRVFVLNEISKAFEDALDEAFPDTPNPTKGRHRKVLPKELPMELRRKP